MDLIKLSNRILVIDDSQDAHDAFRKILQGSHSRLDPLKKVIFDEEKRGEKKAPIYELEGAYQGEEGIDCVRTSLLEKRPFFATFVDVRMPPGIDGIEAIKKIWEIDQDIQTVLCTAYNDYTWPDMIHHLGQSDRLLILKKPFENIEVRQIASALSEKWHLLQKNRYQLQQLQFFVEERTAEIRGTLEATRDGILVINHAYQILDYNKNFLEIWKQLSYAGKGIDELISQRDLSQVMAFMCANIKEADQFRYIFENFLKKQGQHEFPNIKYELNLVNQKSVTLFSRPLILNKEVVGIVFSFRDITEQRYFEKQLAFQATHDLLTHLPNRALLKDRLEQAIFQAKRTQTKTAILFLDLDRFKLINDSLGHQFGDYLLQKVARRLTECKRETDTLCRVGGDEFIFIMPGLEEEKAILPAVQKIQTSLSDPFVIDHQQISITMSLGISFFPKNGQNAEELLKNADAAMYRAKVMGKNTFQFYTTELDLEIHERLKMEQSLYSAFKLGQFFLQYQPIVDLKTRKVSGTEALLRWYHPDLGLITPSKFIPVAEEIGLIIPIGEWVLKTVCEQHKQWQKLGISPTPVSVNLSPYQIKNSETIYRMIKILEEMDFDGKNLCLELTENTMMENTKAVQEIFKLLHEKGVTFVIDDFGTGFSNLNYLVHFPIKKLKIDKSFIENLDKDAAQLPMIKAIVTLAHSLKLKVVVEGVETESQYQQLCSIECDEIQGFYVSKPLDLEAYLSFMQQRETSSHF